MTTIICRMQHLCICLILCVSTLAADESADSLVDPKEMSPALEFSSGTPSIRPAVNSGNMLDRIDDMFRLSLLTPALAESADSPPMAGSLLGKSTPTLHLPRMTPVSYASLTLLQSESGEEDDSLEEVDPDGWTFALIPYIWIPVVAGEGTVKGQSASFGMDMGDILNKAQFAFTGHAHAQKGKWRFIVDGAYFDLEADAQIAFIELTSQLEYGQVDFAVGYTVYETEVRETDHLELGVKVGTRWQYLGGYLDTNLLPRFSGSQDWQELLVGGRASMSSGNLGFAVNLDFSGFGIGSGSELTWNFYLGTSYNLTKHMNLAAGYRLLDIDYSRGTGAKKTALDAQFSGPAIAIAFHW